MKTHFKKFIDFLNRDIWRIRSSQLKGVHSLGIRQLRVFLLAIRGFGEDKCQLWASALTFYTLLSVVPVVAMAFGIAKGFGMEKLLEKQVLQNLQGQEEVAQRIITFAQSFLMHTKGGVIAGVGVALLFWTVVKVLGNIEHSFNEIWGIKKDRTFGRKFSDYMSIMMICPILLIMSSSATVVITSQVHLLVDKLSFLGPVVPVILTFLKILPFAVIWVVFTFIYLFLPNTKVQFKSGLMGGILAGTIYQMVQWAYINFQIGVSKFGAIYGSFAALPLFLIWLQISWLIVLFGAEVAFAEQNVETYEFEPDCLNASHAFKRLVSLAVAHACIKNFSQAQNALRAHEISHQLEVPIRLVRQLLYELTEAGVLAEVKVDEANTVAYQPARDIEPLTIKKVSELLDQHGNDNIPLADTESVRKIREALNEFDRSLQNSPANILLKTI